eukprot:TRINITY_DN55924_c0_g1_i1.p2 TRINITY_DN55924_c0_g1~~TRINITY_DN55924_c0_g1_i1.p2  ORF type:complete len:169 (-),score=39.46 TRINITY_DN55924_c0_g1_i1:8-514(-)
MVGEDGKPLNSRQRRLLKRKLDQQKEEPPAPAPAPAPVPKSPTKSIEPTEADMAGLNSRQRRLLKRKMAVGGGSPLQQNGAAAPAAEEETAPAGEFDPSMPMHMLLGRSRGKRGKHQEWEPPTEQVWEETPALPKNCLLYTSDAADEEDSVDLGGCGSNEKNKIDKKK